MFKHIAVIAIPVGDQERAKAFYRDTLGFRLIAEGPVGPKKTWVQLGLPGAETSVTLVNWFDTMPAGSLRGAVLHVDNIDASRATLLDKGAAPTAVQVADWGRFFTFSDPDGNVWVAMQR